MKKVLKRIISVITFRNYRKRKRVKKNIAEAIKMLNERDNQNIVCFNKQHFTSIQ